MVYDNNINIWRQLDYEQNYVVEFRGYILYSEV